jgi:ferrochelatase
MHSDHILLIGYGAPAKAEDVMPFLRGMTEGREVSEERLQRVAKHYEKIGSASPYHDRVADFRKRFIKELRGAGIDVPVFVGMKNWHPFLGDVLAEIRGKGLRRGIAVPLTPYRAASFGAGYKKNLESILSKKNAAELRYHFVEGWYDQKLFIEAQAEAITQVLNTVPSGERVGTPVLFSFHALPMVQDPADPLAAYPEEARAASALVAERLGHAKGSVVYQSRPVSAKIPWLGPDIADEIAGLAEKGEKRVLIAPLGFLCDHAEILYDLDHQAKALAEEKQMQYLRSKTVLNHPKIAALLALLIQKESHRTPL